MDITYREAEPKDAAQLLDYLKAVGGESDNLTFGAAGIPFTVAQEEQLLASIQQNSHKAIFLALDEDRIVGNATVDGSKNIRFAHRCNLAITVRKDYWGRGIGSGLMERLIAYAKSFNAEVINLEVRSDNERAKALYRKFGFVSFGTIPKFMKINGQYFDADYMTLSLK